MLCGGEIALNTGKGAIAELAEIKSFSKKMLADTKGLLLYGAGAWGKLVLETLQSWILEDNRLKSKGIHIVFIDRLKEFSGFEGISIKKKEFIKEYPNYDVLICAPSAYTEILEELKIMRGDRLDHVFDIIEILRQPEPKTYVNIHDCLDGDVLLEKYEYYRNRKQIGEDILSGSNGKGAVLPFLGISVTERCSLNCEKCIAMVPYYANPQNFNFDDMQLALNRLVDSVDKILEVSFVGGEVFMNKEFYKYLEWAISKRKIRSISVLTNATILPDQRMIDLLKHKKVVFGIDDYGILSSKRDNLIALAKKHNIKYYILYNECWQDIGTLERKHYSVEKKNAIFRCCSFKDCNLFLKGKVYRCQHEAHLENLGICKNSETDYLDLAIENNLVEIRKKLEKLITKTEALEACDFCNDITQNMFRIPVAEQKKR